MRKTYEGLGWWDVGEKLRNARELGLLEGVVLTPVGENFDWDVTVAFSGFDEGSVARRIIAVDLADPAGGAAVAMEVSGGVARVVEIPRGEAPEEAPAPAPEVEPAPEPEVEAEPDEKPAPEEIPEPEIEVVPDEDPEPDPEPETPAIAAAAKKERRKCRGCGKRKRLSEFGADQRTADGRAHTCSECKGNAARRSTEARLRNAREREAAGEDPKAAAGAEDAGPETAGETPEGTKPCARCGDEEGPKPLSEFADSTNLKSNPDGKVKVCRTCRSGIASGGAAANNHWRGARGLETAPDREAAAGKVQKKRCRVCGPTVGPRPLTEFARRADRSEFPDGRAKVCRECSLKAGAAAPKPAADPELGDWEGKLEEVASGHGTPQERRPTIYCANGDGCAAPGIEGPAPLGPGKKEGDECYRCEETDRGRLTSSERLRAQRIEA